MNIRYNKDIHPLHDYLRDRYMRDKSSEVVLFIKHFGNDKYIVRTMEDIGNGAMRKKEFSFISNFSIDNTIDEIFSFPINPNKFETIVHGKRLYLKKSEMWAVTGYMTLDRYFKEIDNNIRKKDNFPYKVTDGIDILTVQNLGYFIGHIKQINDNQKSLIDDDYLKLIIDNLIHYPEAFNLKIKDMIETLEKFDVTKRYVSIYR